MCRRLLKFGLLFAAAQPLISSGAVVFDRDFTTREGDPSLDGFEIVRSYDGVGKDAMRLAAGYGISFPLRGNIHLVRMPAQRDCTVDCSMVSEAVRGDCVDFDVYYRYDAATRVGGVLNVEFDLTNGVAKVRSGVVRGQACTWMGSAETVLAGGTGKGRFSWRLSLDGGTVRFGTAAFDVPDGVPDRGGIGFDKFRPFSPLVISRLTVDGEAAKAAELFPRRVWRFPSTALSSMADWRFVFAATNAGPNTVLSAAVEGGPVEASNRHVDPARGLPNEALDRPWFAVVDPDGRVGSRQYLYFGRIGRREHWDRRLPWMDPADVECPVRGTYYLPGIAAGSRLLIGFDGFLSEDRRHLGEPKKMMLVDPTTGETLAVGDILDANGFALEVDSGSDKAICGMIPKSTKGFDEARDYAARNHFFFDDEAASFEVRVRHAGKRFATDALEVVCTLQDAFKDDVRTLAGTTRLRVSAFPGEDGIAVAVEPLKLPVGVYHLGIAVKAHGETVLEKSVAFEVLGRDPDAPSPQLASGLPEMMSPVCDYHSGSNVSDYRGAGGNDVTHYFAINGMQVLPTVERDDWNLNKLYRRRYFGWFHHKLVPNQRPETFAPRFKDIDYLCTELLVPTRQPAWAPGDYRGEFRNVLSDFLRDRCDGDSDFARLASDPSAPVTLPVLKKILERHGQDWLDRVAAYHAEKSAAGIAKWRDVRTLVQYFTVPYYVWHCKGAFHAKTYGVDVLRHPERIWYSGFAILEDYPYLVGESPLEGVYAMAALKMDAPELKLAPEVMGVCAIPADLATIYGCPPYGVMNDGDCNFKRFIDFKYTACWYRDGAFRYWTDDKILLRNPTPAQADDVLSTWREVRRHAPVRPVRTFAIVTGSASCSRHPLKALSAQTDGDPFLDVVNTAEEFPFWAALAVKGNGLPNGFLIRPEELSKMTPDDVHTLILPPLDALSADERSVVRRLHAQGVNLVASENAEGLEDLFGVRRLAKPHTVKSIGGEPSLSGEAEVLFAAAGAETLLKDDAGAAILTCKVNGGASAAFYTCAPSLFSRAYYVVFPWQSGEVLPASAAKLFRRMLPSPEISVSEGRLSACRDQTGGLQLCVMEDAQPKPARAILPVLTVCGDFRKAILTCSQAYELLKNDGQVLQVRLAIGPRECATFHIDKEK